MSILFLENMNCMSYKLFQILPYKQNAIARYYCALPRFYQSYLSFTV